MAGIVNIGLRISSVHPTNVEAVRRFILEAENLGYHSIWVGDHVYYRVDVVEPLVLLTWAAAQTSRVRLGTAVMLTAYRNPVTLAKTASSIDYLSELDYYKGDPEDGYVSYVWTQNMTAKEIVAERGKLEEEVREKLNIPFNPSRPGMVYEHSMGMGNIKIPDHILRGTP